MQTKHDLADAIISEDGAVLSSLTSDDVQILLTLQVLRLGCIYPEPELF